MKNKEQIIYLPCLENDDDVSGTYTSYDGTSLCYVKELNNIYVFSADELLKYTKQVANDAISGRLQSAIDKQT